MRAQLLAQFLHRSLENMIRVALKWCCTSIVPVCRQSISPLTCVVVVTSGSETYSRSVRCTVCSTRSAPPVVTAHPSLSSTSLFDAFSSNRYTTLHSCLFQYLYVNSALSKQVTARFPYKTYLFRDVSGTVNLLVIFPTPTAVLSAACRSCSNACGRSKPRLRRVSVPSWQHAMGCRCKSW